MTERNYTRKARALFLAALMVFSVFAGTVAFAGTTAASVDSLDNASATDVDAYSASAEQEVTFDVGVADGEEDTFTIDVSTVDDITLNDVAGVESSNPDEVSVSASTDGDTAEITTTDENDDGVSEATITVTLDVDTDGVAHTVDIGAYTVNEDGGAATADTNTFSVIPPDGDQTLDSGSTFWAGQELALGTGAELSANDELQVREWDTSGDTNRIGGLEEEFSLDGDGVATLDTGDYDDGEYIIVDADNSNNAVEFTDGFASATSTTAADYGGYTFEITTQNLDVEIDEDSVTDDGENAVTEIDVDSNRANYELNVSANGDLDVSELSDIFVANGDYQLEDDNANDDDDEITITLDGTTAEGDGQEISFEGIDAGEYDFTFSVPDSTAESSDTVEVTEQDIDSAFSQGVSSDTAGDIAEFTVELEDTDEIYVQFGDEDVGFIDVLWLEDDDDDGEVTFEVNTRTLGSPGADTAEVYHSEDDNIESEVHGDDTDATFWDEDTDSELGDGTFGDYLEELDLIDDVDDDPRTQLTRPLQPADYELMAAANGEFIVNSDGDTEAEREIDSALFELTAPSLDGITTHVAPEDNADADDELEDLLDAATAREEIAEDDRLIIQVEASGLYGAIVHANGGDFSVLEDGTTLASLGVLTGEDTDEQDWTGEGISFDVEADDATGNQEATSLDLENNNAGDGYVLYDEENGQFFVVVDTTGDAFTQDVGDGDEFDVTMEYETDSNDRYEFIDDAEAPYEGGAGGDIGDEAYPYFQTGSSEELTSTVEIVEQSVTFDNVNNGVLEVEAGEEATISGMTNIAPGSDAEIRVSSTDADPSFRSTSDVDIEDDGFFEATFDFSEQSEGDLADTTFRVGGSSVDTIDTELVDAVSEETDTPEPDTDTPEPDTDTPEPDTDTPEPDTPEPDTDTPTETDTGTPGFGVVVALTALIAAALLAVRRD
ncbi:BGTF surface domain-containing protein [Halobellus rarus]|uniref:BGTF surface domain-containing protein n=1 Tax=Halobellus rarus TaxID=1126237 RepID=A0ABD6CIQ5_9EURY|nr:BGTF surface domain-containing protein [Halobellus rarus]